MKVFRIQVLRNFFAGLSKREQRLLLISSLVLFAFVIFLFVFFVQLELSDLRSENETYEKALALISKEENKYLKAKQQNSEALQSGQAKPTPLRTLIDKLARQLNVEVPDVKELPEERHGAGWIEHSVELSMREIGLVNLTKFMEEVEKNRMKFPIAITKLEIRDIARVQDAYNVTIVISTYERTEEDGSQNSKGRTGGTRKGGA